MIAPSLVPMKSGDRIKTDRRVAEGLRVPTKPVTSHQCGFRIRSTKRCATWCERERPRRKTKCAPSIGLRAIVDALQALRGVAKVTAVTLATEFGCFSRCEKAGQVMSYTGMVPTEHSSGPKTRRGAITKTGNSHLRRVLVESAWHYRHRPRLCKHQTELTAAKDRNHRDSAL